MSGQGAQGIGGWPGLKITCQDMWQVKVEELRISQKGGPSLWGDRATQGTPEETASESSGQKGKEA